MAELRLLSDDGGIDIDLVSGVWRVERGMITLPGSDDDALNRLQSGDRLAWTWPLAADASADYGNAGEAISYALEQARQWVEDPLRGNTLWLQARPGGQYTRRYMIKGGVFAELTSAGADLFWGKTVRRGSLTLYLHVAPPEANDPRDIGQLSSLVPAGGGGRHPVRATYPEDEASGDGVDLPSTGGTLEIPGRGTRPGRIGVLALETEVSTSSGITKYWAGLKSLYHEAGVASEFVPSWMIQDGTYTYLGSPFAAGAVGSGETGYVWVTITYNSGDWGRVFSISLAQVYSGSYPEHFIGRYRVIMRADISPAPQTIRFRLGYGLSSEADGEGLIYNDPVYVTTTDTYAGDYRLVELGSVIIPPFGYRQGGDVKKTVLQLDANHLDAAGSATINFNRLILVPEPRLLHIPKAGYLASTGTDVNTTLYYTAPDDVASALVYRDGNLRAAPQVQPTPAFYLPVEGALLVVVGAGDDFESSLSNLISVGARVYDRYASWRGAG